MTEKSEALRLADALEDDLVDYSGQSLPRISQDIADKAAAELRRLHADNKLLHQRHHDDNVEYTRVLAQRNALLEALQNLDANPELTSAWLQARAAIKTVEEK